MDLDSWSVSKLERRRILSRAHWLRGKYDGFHTCRVRKFQFETRFGCAAREKWVLHMYIHMLDRRTSVSSTLYKGCGFVKVIAELASAG